MRLHLYYQGPFYKKFDKKVAFAYVSSGAIVTMSDYAAFSVLFSMLDTGLLFSTVGAYLVGLVVSYLLNRYWVYRKNADRQSQATSMWRYVVFLVFNLLLTYGLLWVMENTLSISPYLGKFIVNGFMFFWIYIGNNYFVFSGPKTGPIKL